MAALRYILLAAAITLTLALLAHLLLPARAPIPRCTGRRGGLGIIVNMSHDSIYSDGFENTLAANRLENGALKHGGAVIFRAADFKE